MPSFIVHLLVPPLILGSLGVVPWRYVVYLAPLAVLPDLDFFLGPHRAGLINIWWPLLLSLGAWRLHYHERKEWLGVAVVAYYWTSHVVMDAFAGGIVPFWPFWDLTVLFDVRVVVNTRTLETAYVAEAATQEGVPEVDPIYEWFSHTDGAILTIVALTFAAHWAVRRWRARQTAVG